LAGIREIVDSVQGHQSVEREVKLPMPQQLLTVVASAAALRDDDGSSLGFMIFLEDITQIQKVQRMEAWREVARRIAHEIKNPLTPIQLSAERLRKRYAGMLKDDGAILDKCTTTIIKQVDELKNLVNEFSQFARLPAAQLMSNDLNEVVSEALFLFKEGHNGVDFQFRRGVIPAVDLDREQIAGVDQLADNAVAAVNGGGEIKLATEFDPARARHFGSRRKRLRFGAGIAHKNIRALFFHQTKRHRARLDDREPDYRRSPRLYSRAAEPAAGNTFFH
jgi:two-component system nitrogen regulation sensor histidine kinase NtrY